MKAVVAVLAVVGGAVAACLVWFFLLKGLLASGGIGEYAPYVPEDATGVAFIDMARLRQSELYEQLKDFIEEAEQESLGQADVWAQQLDMDDIEEFFISGSQESDFVFAVRTTKDFDLGSLLHGAAKGETKECSGFAYVEARRGGRGVYAAKTAARIYCFAPKEGILRDALCRLSKKEKLELNQDLQGILDRVTRYDHYFAFVAGGFPAGPRGLPSLPALPFPGFGEPRGIGVGFTVRASIRGEVLLRFAERHEAEAVEQLVHTGLQGAIASMRLAISQLRGTRREEAEKLLRLMGSVGVSRSGAIVAITASARAEEIEELISKAGLGLGRARTEARLIRDRNNLNQLARGCATYLNEFGDNRFYPKNIGELFDKGVLKDETVLVSPLDRNPPRLPNGLRCSYVSCFDKYPKRVFRDDFPPYVIMAWDRKAFVKGRRNVLFFDSHVERVDEARFAELLKDLDKHVKQQATKRRTRVGVARRPAFTKKTRRPPIRRRPSREKEQPRVGPHVPAKTDEPKKTVVREPKVITKKPVTPARPGVQVIASAAELEQALADKTPGIVLWVPMRRQALSRGSLKELQAWVRRGGVLWVDTDLVRVFGFPNLRQAPESYMRGEAEAMTKYKHPILAELARTKVSYEFTGRPFVMIDTGMGRGPTTPLLGRRTKRGAMAVLCAIRAYGRGFVVYRPARIAADSKTGRRFDANLRAFSLSKAKRAAKTSK